VAALSGKPVLAFAGIGDPARFFRTLRASGIDVRRERVFADHHPFDRAEIEALVAEAARDRLTLVTTEKDLVRLRMPAELASLAPRMVPFPVTLAFDDTAALRSLLADRLFAARQRQFQRTA
jgi:tetraacyldisaccharide 4'-kinase